MMHDHARWNVVHVPCVPVCSLHAEHAKLLILQVFLCFFYVMFLCSL